MIGCEQFRYYKVYHIALRNQNNYSVELYKSGEFGKYILPWMF